MVRIKTILDFRFWISDLKSQGCYLKSILILTILSIPVNSAFPRGAQDTLPELVRRIKPSVVSIVTYDNRGQRLTRGSGFFTAPDRIVTNRHVIEKAYKAEVHLTNGNAYNVRGVLAVDGAGDIALLQVEVPASLASPLQVVRTTPQEGERVVVIGNPLGLEGSVSDGIVSAVRDIPNFGRIIQITAPISPGSSGSPVINMQGQVIGVATLQLTEGQSLNFAIPSDRVALLQGQTLVPRTLGGLAEDTIKSQRAQAERFYTQGLGFLSRDDCETALGYFKRATDADPKYAEAWAQTGFCNEKLGRHGEALKASRQVISLRPDSAESYFNMGLAYYHTGQFKESVEAYRQALRLDPESAETNYALGLSYGKMGRTDDEIQAYRRAVRLRLDYSIAYERLAQTYARAGRFADAVWALNKLVELKPGDAKAYNSLGEAYIKLNRAAEAVAAFRQATLMKPDFARAYFNLGKGYLAMGNRDGALEQLNILRTLDPDLADELNTAIPAQ
jgi:tetratricopeptide (TPR) repeat protein